MIDLNFPRMLRRCIPILTIGAVGLCFPAIAQTTVETEFAAWLDGVRAEALERQISETVIERALRDVKPVKRIIERDRNQAEFKLTLDTYMNRVVTEHNVAYGRKMARTHGDLLDRVSARYRVQPRFILAIWGIETRYGAIKADVPVIPSVATLAFDRRRSKYFRSQLMATLEMLDKGYIELENLKGSWAGAMGQPQFMPSSYLAYAQDFDGDGRRDIWDTPADVFASIANYLAKHGWRDDVTWGRAVQLPKALESSPGPLSRRAASGCRATTTETRRLSEWQSLGVRRIDGTDLPTRDLPAAMVLPDGTGGGAYLVYRNYAAIMSYNCAHLYAVTVGVLSDRIGRG